MQTNHTLGKLHRIPPYWYPDSELKAWTDKMHGPYKLTWKTRDQARLTLQNLINHEYLQSQEEETAKLLNF